jgi:hypothetical protein
MIKQNFLGQMVAPVHKNTNAPLILIVCDFIFCMLAKHIFGDFSRFFEGVSTFLNPKLPFNLGFKKSWSPRKTPRNRRLCVLPALKNNLPHD